METLFILFIIIIIFISFYWFQDKIILEYDNKDNMTNESINSDNLLSDNLSVGEITVGSIDYKSIDSIVSINVDNISDNLSNILEESIQK